MRGARCASTPSSGSSLRTRSERSSARRLWSSRSGRPHTAFSWGAITVYSLAAGLVAALSRSMMAMSCPAQRPAWRRPSSSRPFGALHLLYFANVKLLPGEPYSHTKSLAADALFSCRPRSWRSCCADRRGLKRCGTVTDGPLAVVGLGHAAGLTRGACRGWPPVQSAPERGGQGPNLVLIVVDSLRNDRRPTAATPAYHARHPRPGRTEAAVYTEAFASSSWTVPSVTRMLGADRPGRAQPFPSGSVPALGDAAACFTDNPHLTPASTDPARLRPCRPQRQAVAIDHLRHRRG